MKTNFTKTRYVSIFPYKPYASSTLIWYHIEMVLQFVVPLIYLIVFLNAYWLYRKISLPYSVRLTRTNQEHLQLRSGKKSSMTFVKGILKWSFIWKASRWATLLIFWRIQRGLMQLNRWSWILKISKQPFLKWIPRWKCFQLRPRYYIYSWTFGY